jgi:hypothetical protein
MEKARRKLDDWIGYAVLVLLVGPFVVVYAAAFLGFPIMDVPGFATWLMGALTVGGAITFISLVQNGLSTRKMPWGWLAVIVGATFFWGRTFLHIIT